MRLFARLASRKYRSPEIQRTGRRARLEFEALENRVCPSVVGVSLNGGVLTVTEISGGATGTSLAITGDKAAGAGNTSTLFITGGLGTAVNAGSGGVNGGGNQVNVPINGPGALAAINVILLGDPNQITVGQVGGVVSLPGTSLSVSFVSGATGPVGNTSVLLVGSPSTDIANTLNSVTWTAPATLQGQNVAGFFHSTTAGVVVTQNNAANDLVALVGAAPSLTKITQGNGAGDLIVSQAYTVTPVNSSLGITAFIQGDGNNSTVILNNTTTQNLSVIQGNGIGDEIAIGYSGSGSPAANVTTAGQTLVQGTGNGDVIALGSLKDTGGVSITQKDVFGNSIGALVYQFFTASTVGGDASFQSLSITQGTAVADTVLLAQLAGQTNNHTLTVTGQLAAKQNDQAGHGGDNIVIGSYTPAAPTTPPFTPTPTATGSVVAGSVQTTQGDAAGNLLVVVFTTTNGSGFNFVQGNGGDQAIFQKDNATNSGTFVYSGGSGLNYVQVDSTSSSGGGSISVTGSHSIFATDFKDFFGNAFSIPIFGFGSVIFG